MKAKETECYISCNSQQNEVLSVDIINQMILGGQFGSLSSVVFTKYLGLFLHSLVRVSIHILVF